MTYFRDGYNYYETKVTHPRAIFPHPHDFLRAKWATPDGEGTVVEAKTDGMGVRLVIEVKVP